MDRVHTMLKIPTQQHQTLGMRECRLPRISPQNGDGRLRSNPACLAGATHRIIRTPQLEQEYIAAGRAAKFPVVTKHRAAVHRRSSHLRNGPLDKRIAVAAKEESPVLLLAP